jgi:hypothetical protein
MPQYSVNVYHGLPHFWLTCRPAKGNYFCHRRVMRKLIMLIWSALVVSGCTPGHMVKVADCPDLRTIKPPAGKSALVLAETTSFENYDLEDNSNIHNYLDRKFIGTIRSYSFLVATVDPGEHYVTSNGENNETILLNFKLGTTYYLEQQRSKGIAHPRTRYILVKGDRVFNDMHGKCTRYEPDAHDPGADLDEDKFKEIVNAYIRKNGKVPFNEVEPSKIIKWDDKAIQ